MQIDNSICYEPKKIGIIPIGFYYPGRTKSGDLPPRKERVPHWHQKLLDKMDTVQLIILIGRYAQWHFLGNRSKSTLTETIRNFKNYLPDYYVLPHPSLNNGRQRMNGSSNR